MGASVATIRSLGTDLVVQSNPIPEPLNPPDYLASHLTRFDPGIYNLNVDSHLYRYLLAVAGDAGAGFLQRLFFTASLQQRLEGAHFTDLDKFFALLTTFPRDVDELYTYNPRSQSLTEEQWQEVYRKDGSYRSRGLAWMKSLADGASPLGIKGVASAVLGVDCFVFEQYQYLDNPTIFPNLGQTGNRLEFVIVPLEPSIDQADLKTLANLIDKIRPANSICSVYNPSAEGKYTGSLTNYFPRITQAPLHVAASSTYFTVKRFVTGRTNVNWPAPDPSQGYWIVPGSGIEAPSFAFSDPQEDAFFATVQSITASSYHTGPFNPIQQQLFSNLTNTSTAISYPPQNAIAQTIEPLQSSSQWVTGYGLDPGTVVVNNHYPISYFELVPLSFNTSNPNQYFWSSEQQLSGTSEVLNIDLGAAQQYNWIDFESTQKPLDITIEYSTDGINYTEVEPVDLFTYTGQLAYIPSQTNPWIRFECKFQTVIAQYFQITFVRRADPFPLITSNPVPFSVEARNLRIGHVVFDTSDMLTDDSGNFLTNVGVDILGNQVQTAITTYDAINTINGSETAFWQSQPNPSPFAVESLYFDMRLSTNSFVGVQGLIDTYTQSTLDDLDQADIEIEYPEGQVINEIYLDPITTGPTMNVYYTNDDDPDWDNKLWTPVNRTYILRKGFIILPQPILCKYVKLEFTNLVPRPYGSPDYPPAPPITYNKYPSWVQLFFNTLYPVQLSSQSLLYPFDTVTIDPLAFGFIPVGDNLDTGLSEPYIQPQTVEQQTQRAALSVASPGNPPNPQEADIIFNSSFMWQEDLIQQLDTSRFLSRFVQLDHTTLLPTESSIQELPTPDSPASDSQSVVLLDPSEREKKLPIMFFPFTCRHAYQQVEAARPSKIAYMVAMNAVSFYRRDYTAQYDEPYYSETLDDAQNIFSNDFTENGLLYSIPLLSDINIPQATTTLVTNTSMDEDFDEANGAIAGS